jgi:hypothetical protein
MGCNCKSDKNIDIDNLSNEVSNPNESLASKITKYFFKSLAFLLMIAALPIINLFIIWFIFKMLILNKDINIKPLLKNIGDRFRPIDDEDEDEDEYDNLTEHDVVMMGVEDITNRSK